MMPRRAAIAALEHAATHGGDLAEARRFLGRVDPLVRARALRIVRGAVADAETAVRVRGDDAPAHSSGARRAVLAPRRGSRSSPKRWTTSRPCAQRSRARALVRAARRWVWPFTWPLAVALAAGALVTVRTPSAPRARPAAARRRGRDRARRCQLPPAVA